MPYIGMGDSTLDPLSAITGVSTSDLVSGLTGQFNWEDWALLGIGTLVFFELVGRGSRLVSRGVSKKTRKVSSGLKKRKRALKTVFTG